MALENLDELFEKAKQTYPDGYQNGDTIWQLVDAYVATKNYAFDDKLILQSRREGGTIKNYSNYVIDYDEME
jgi:hypothetical protein